MGSGAEVADPPVGENLDGDAQPTADFACWERAPDGVIVSDGRVGNGIGLILETLPEILHEARGC